MSNLPLRPIPWDVQEEVMEGTILRSGKDLFPTLKTAYYNILRATKLIDDCQRKENPERALRRFGFELVDYGDYSIVIDHVSDQVLVMSSVDSSTYRFHMHVIGYSNHWQRAEKLEDKARLISLNQFVVGEITVDEPKSFFKPTE